MKTSSERILTTHVGSLARPHRLLDIMRDKVAGKPYHPGEFARQARDAAFDVVRRQAECGIDIVGDGEQSKAGFNVYIADRLGGFEVDTLGAPQRAVWKEELDQFPEYYREYLGGKAETMVHSPPLVCNGPVTYTGQQVLQTDIDNLKAAVAAAPGPIAEAF